MTEMKWYLMVAYSQHTMPARSEVRLIKSATLRLDQVANYCQNTYGAPAHVTVEVHEINKAIHMEDSTVDMQLCRSQEDLEWEQSERDGTCFQCGTAYDTDGNLNRVCPECSYRPNWAADA